MITRGVRIQLVVFGIISVVSIGYLTLGYGDAQRTTGLTSYEIKADFADTSGLYPRALVSYRGVQVGRVQSLDLTSDGAAVTLAIDSDVQIPVGARAEIHSTSAVGEQYVDLVPDRRSGPFIKAGAAIPRQDTREMPQIAPVLDRLDGLLESVPKKQTARLLDQVDEGFGSSSEDLDHLLDSSTELVEAAHDGAEATTRLLTTLPPVLKTQSDIGGLTRAYAASLAGVSGQVKKNDPNLRSILTHGPPALDAVSGLVDRLTPTFSILMANLVSSGEALNAYVPNLKQAMVLYPALVDRLQGTSLAHGDDGIIKLDIEMNLNNPPPCTDGYIPISSRRDPADTSPESTPRHLHCTKASSAPEGVRGARNIPCPQDPARRAASPAGCGLVFPGKQSHPYGISRPRRSPDHDGTIQAFAYATPSRIDSWTDLMTEPLR